MVFKVNDLEWEVIFKDQIEFKKRTGSLEEDSVYFGLTVKELDELWLSNEIKKDTLLYRTIKHELTHVYMESYGFSQFNTFTEENVADFIECYAESIVETAKSIFANILKSREKN